jgi:hypothetical protein
MVNEQLAKVSLPDNVLNFKAKNVNLNIGGDIISLVDLEKIFFLSKVNCTPEFISTILNMEVLKIDRIINSLEFQKTCNQYFQEFSNNNAGENISQLTLRYTDLLKECFISIRSTVGIRIREAIESGKGLDGKWLNLPLIEKLMRLEFALHGMPIDLRGVIVKHNKGSKDKTDEELLDSVKEIQNTLSDIQGNKKLFNPASFIEVEEEEKELNEEIEKEIEQETIEEDLNGKE